MGVARCSMPATALLASLSGSQLCCLLGAQVPLSHPTNKQEIPGFHATGNTIAMLSSFEVLLGWRREGWQPRCPLLTPGVRCFMTVAFPLAFIMLCGAFLMHLLSPLPALKQHY